MKMKNAKSHAMGERNTEADLIQSVIGNRAKFVFAAHVVTDSSTAGSLYRPKKRVQIYAKDAATGNRHTWFKGVQVKASAFGTAGAAGAATLRVVPATLTFVDGQAACTVQFQAGRWATVIDTNKFRCLGENIATQHIWKWYFKK